MTLTAEQILDALRALPAAERLRVVERVVHEVATEVTPEPPPTQEPAAVWADESDDDFGEFQNAIARMRATDVWRAGDGPRTD